MKKDKAEQGEFTPQAAKRLFVPFKFLRISFTAILLTLFSHYGNSQEESKSHVYTGFNSNNRLIQVHASQSKSEKYNSIVITPLDAECYDSNLFTEWSSHTENRLLQLCTDDVSSSKQNTTRRPSLNCLKKTNPKKVNPNAQRGIKNRSLSSNRIDNKPNVTSGSGSKSTNANRVNPNAKMGKGNNASSSNRIKTNSNSNPEKGKNSNQSKSSTSVANNSRKKLFVSYCRTDADKNFLKKLKAKLEELEYVVWIDHEIDIGVDWAIEIKKAIKEALAIIVVMTPKASASHWVTYEWGYADGKNKRIIPLMHKPTKKIHEVLNKLQFINFTNRTAHTWNYLYETLGKLKIGGGT